MISRIVAVLIMMVAGVAQTETSQPTRRLLSADEARAWQAVGRVNLPNDGFCTRALIAPNLVLTAAHCVFDPLTNARLAPDEVSFAAG